MEEPKNKLQALTDKVYQEGVEKAQQEAEEIRKNARAEAQAIRTEAQEKAANLLKKAQQEAQDLKKQNEVEIRLAAQKTIASLKQKIAHLVVSPIAKENTRKALADPSFLKDIIKTAISNWDPHQSGPTNLRVLLAPEKAQALIDAFKNNALAVLDQRLDIGADPRIPGGFSIAPQDGGFVVQFTDEAFARLFEQFVKPEIARFLFEKTEAHVETEA